jgi:hypothetical protein
VNSKHVNRQSVDQTATILNTLKISILFFGFILKEKILIERISVACYYGTIKAKLVKLSSLPSQMDS